MCGSLCQQSGGLVRFEEDSPPVPGSFRNQSCWGGSFSSLPHFFIGEKLKGKEKTILGYFVPLAVRMGCLFVLGGLPDMGILIFFSFSLFFLQKLNISSRAPCRFCDSCHLPAAGWVWTLGCTHRRGGEDGEGGKFQEYPGAAGCWVGLLCW